MYSIEDAIIDSQGLKGIKNQIIREGGMTLLRNLKNKFGIGTTIVNSGDIATATNGCVIMIKDSNTILKIHIR